MISGEGVQRLAPVRHLHRAVGALDDPSELTLPLGLPAVATSGCQFFRHVELVQMNLPVFSPLSRYSVMPWEVTRIVPPRLASFAVLTTAPLAGADDWLAGAGLLLAELDELEELPHALNSTVAATPIVGIRKVFEERTLRLLSGDLLRSPYV